MTKTFKEEAEKLINTLITRETHKGSYQRIRIQALAQLQQLHEAEVANIINKLPHTNGEVCSTYNSYNDDEPHFFGDTKCDCYKASLQPARKDTDE